MFEAIVFGVMLHSHHLEDPENEAVPVGQGVIEMPWGGKYLPRGTVNYGEEFKYNNATRGLYVIADGWTAAAFHNSYGKLSVFGGYTFAKETSFGEFAASVGGATGYERRTYHWVKAGTEYAFRSKSGGKVIPVGMLSYATPAIPGTPLKARLMYTPRKNVLTLGVEAKF